jgi:hypothetical protein
MSRLEIERPDDRMRRESHTGDKIQRLFQGNKRYRMGAASYGADADQKVDLLRIGPDRLNILELRGMSNDFKRSDGKGGKNGAFRLL